MKQIFINAKKLIEAGWGQGDDLVLPLDSSFYCVATACTRAEVDRAKRDGDDYRSVLPAADVFRAANGIPDHISLGDWNDAPERTKDEVLAAFDKAIEAAR